LEVGSGTGSGQRYTGQGARFQIQQVSNSTGVKFNGADRLGRNPLSSEVQVMATELSIGFMPTCPAKDGRSVSIPAFQAIAAIRFEPIGHF